MRQPPSWLVRTSVASAWNSPASGPDGTFKSPLTDQHGRRDRPDTGHLVTDPAALVDAVGNRRMAVRNRRPSRKVDLGMLDTKQVIAHRRS
jgi:hypothetical protein